MTSTIRRYSGRLVSYCVILLSFLRKFIGSVCLLESTNLLLVPRRTFSRILLWWMLSLTISWKFQTVFLMVQRHRKLSRGLGKLDFLWGWVFQWKLNMSKERGLNFEYYVRLRVFCVELRWKTSELKLSSIYRAAPASLSLNKLPSTTKITEITEDISI